MLNYSIYKVSSEILSEDMVAVLRLADDGCPNFWQDGQAKLKIKGHFINLAKLNICQGHLLFKGPPLPQ